jgi:hypothetical protein
MVLKVPMLVIVVKVGWQQCKVLGSEMFWVMQEREEDQLLSHGKHGVQQAIQVPTLQLL